MYECPYCQKPLENIDLETSLLHCPHCKNEISLMEEVDQTAEIFEAQDENRKSSNPPPPSSFSSGLENQESLDLIGEIEKFGNSSEASTLEGPLKFSLVLSGIDSLDLEKEVFHILSDKKLFLEVTSLKSKLKKGVLKIESLSPVKASFLVRSFQHLPLKISWSQKSYQKE